MASLTHNFFDFPMAYRCSFLLFHFFENHKSVRRHRLIQVMGNVSAMHCLFNALWVALVLTIYPKSPYGSLELRIPFRLLSPVCGWQADSHPLTLVLLLIPKSLPAGRIPHSKQFGLLFPYSPISISHLFIQRLPHFSCQAI